MTVKGQTRPEGSIPSSSNTKDSLYRHKQNVPGLGIAEVDPVMTNSSLCMRTFLVHCTTCPVNNLVTASWTGGAAPELPTI